MILSKPSSDFFESLGYYVYGYRKNSKWLYIGKGVGDRAYAHVKEKGYDWKDCRILARNLERFHNGDIQSASKTALAVESLLINIKETRDNKVNGHYNEVFEMSLFAEIWTEHKNSMRTPAIEVGNIISENEEIRMNVGFTETRANSFVIETKAREGVYFSILGDTKLDSYSIRVKSESKERESKIRETLLEEGYEMIGTPKKSMGTIFSVDNLEDAIYLWEEFVA